MMPGLMIIYVFCFFNIIFDQLKIVSCDRIFLCLEKFWVKLQPKLAPNKKSWLRPCNNCGYDVSFKRNGRRSNEQCLYCIFWWPILRVTISKSVCARVCLPPILGFDFPFNHIHCARQKMIYFLWIFYHFRISVMLFCAIDKYTFVLYVS